MIFALFLGIIGAAVEGTALPCKSITSRLAIICGTSSCHMAVSEHLQYLHAAKMG